MNLDIVQETMKGNRMFKFEVIIPCYNAESTIARTINSLVSQTYQNWRIWFINDGSTDKSLDITWTYQEEIQKRSWNRGTGLGLLNIFTGPNQGVSSALNFGRSKVLEFGDESSLVCYCGADDWYDRRHFEIYTKEFEKNPDIDFLYSDVQCFFPDGNPAYPWGIPYHEVLDISKLPFENPIFTPSVAHKLKCFSVGEFDSRLNSIEDWDFFCRVAKGGHKMIHFRGCSTNVTVRDERWKDGLAGKRTNEQWNLFIRKREEERNT